MAIARLAACLVGLTLIRVSVAAGYPVEWLGRGGRALVAWSERP